MNNDYPFGEDLSDFRHSNAKFFMNQGQKVSQSRFLRKLRIVETESLEKINAGMKLGHGIT
jgi:hypothetical protein